MLADFGFLLALLAGIFGVVSPTLREVSLNIAVVMLAVSVWIFLQGTAGRREDIEDHAQEKD